MAARVSGVDDGAESVSENKHPALPVQSYPILSSTPQAFNKIQVPSHMHQMGYRDKAWSVNRLGAIAAK